MNKCNLYQHVSYPTHIYGHVLDLIITNASSNLVTCPFLLDAFISGHKTLCVKKSTCLLDPVPSNLQRHCIDSIAPIITRIVNLSLSSNVFSKQLKSALVKPFLKKSNLDPNDLKNYRPISNLYFLSKLIERVIAVRLSSHLSSHNVMSKLQSAYRKFHFSEKALLYVQNDILASFDAGHFTALLLLDLSAAFDTIDHSILTHRLQPWFGISSTALNLLSSFLSDRSQTVITPASKSNPILLEYGVLQYSVL